MVIAGDRDLSDFLQSRPRDEELGESLDRYERKLLAEGKLSEEAKKEIRDIHLQYLSNLIDSDLPIKVVTEVNTQEDNIIQGFCEDQVFLNKANLEETHMRRFADAYQWVKSPYVNYYMAKILIRYHLSDKAWTYYENALKVSLFSIDSFWNNKESIYACSELLFDIASHAMFGQKNLDGELYGKILEYLYLILSRDILWPEDTDGRFEEFDIPITYRHKISCLNKRAEILLRHRTYFEELIPSYSTSESLAIADYSSAHNYAFVGKQTGLKSLFKLDAESLYNKVTKGNIEAQKNRPFSTAILDGKRDCVELAHRLYLKYRKDEYKLTTEEYTQINELLKAIVYEKNEPVYKDEATQINQFLSDNGIKYLYHFTEKENIDNIKKYGGICSLKYCLIHAIEVITKGDMTVLRDTDAGYELENYARLSFCERHPLIKKRQQAGADLVLLKIKLDVAWLKDTLFSDRDAASEHLQGDTLADLKKVKMEAVCKKNLEEWDPDYEYNQAEVMVKSIIPIEYIVNIDEPIDLSPEDDAPANDGVITKQLLILAITTLARLSELFKNSSFLMAANDGRNERKMITMYSFAGILGYQYEEIYHFGSYCSLVNIPMWRHYTRIKETMADSGNRATAISDLAKNWSDTLQTILEIEYDGAQDSKEFVGLKSEIESVTNVIEMLSGSECRKPTIGYSKTPEAKRSQFYNDAFSHIVEEARYNPYRITTDPELQRFPPIPDLKNIFRTELLQSYEIRNVLKMDATEIFIAYVLSLVETYYKKAGYVPKNTVDAIIEQCDESVRNTMFRWHLRSLDELKFRIYQALFSR